MQVAQAGKRRQQVFNEINITPLTDIFLVLLIIMMVVAPMIHNMRRDITPPQMKSGAPVDQGPLIVEVTQDGTFYIESQPVELTALKDALVKHGEGKEEKNVIIRADKSTKSGAVMKIFEAARDAQYQKVTVAGEPLSDSRQTQLNQNPQEAGS